MKVCTRAGRKRKGTATTRAAFAKYYYCLPPAIVSLHLLRHCLGHCRAGTETCPTRLDRGNCSRPLLAHPLRRSECQENQCSPRRIENRSLVCIDHAPSIKGRRL